MDEPRPLPSTVLQLVVQRGTTLQEAIVECNFCGYPLNIEEKSQSDRKGFRLLWGRGTHPKSICAACIRVSSLLLWLYRHDGTWPGHLVQRACGYDVTAVPVRCTICMTRLTPAYVHWAVKDNQPFHFINGAWKTNCGRCTW